MPLWLDVTIAMAIAALGLRVLLVLIDREPPSPWQDPNLTTQERDDDFWDRQW